MDIHKPKAAHSWRDFAIEIGTIVCGIVIALALEQAVESARMASEVREARQALQREIAANALGSVFAIQVNECIIPQVAAYVVWAKGGPKPPTFRAELNGYESSTWESVKTGAVTQMPLEERLALASFYDLLAANQKVIEYQRPPAFVLLGASERQALSQEDAGRVLDAAATMQVGAYFNRANTKRLLHEAFDMGIPPPPLSASMRRRM